MEAKSYNDVYSEYQDFKQRVPYTQLSLADFAKAKDQYEGTPEARKQAYDAGLLRRAAAGWGRLVDSTEVPWAGEQIGRAVGEQLGASQKIQDVLGGVGRGTPEMLTEATLTGGQSLVPKVLGYLGAGMSGYNETGSAVGGAISAGTLGAANYLLPKVGNAAFKSVQEMLDKNLPQFVRPAVDAPLGRTASDLISEANPTMDYLARNTAIPAVAKIGAEVGAMTGINETARQANLSVAGVPLMDEQRNPLSTENVVANVAGLVPFAPSFLKSFRGRPNISLPQAEAMNQWLGERSTWVDTEKARIAAATPSRAASPEVNMSEHQALINSMINSQFLAADQAMRDGRMDDLESIKAELSNLMRVGGSDDQAIADRMKGLETVARTATPENSQELGVFLDQVNGLIGKWNDMRGNLPALEQQIKNYGFNLGSDSLGPTLHYSTGIQVKNFDSLPEGIRTAFEDYRNASRAQNVSHPKLIEDLQSAGYIEPITEKWFKDQYAVQMMHSINDPEFAWRSTVQKAANHLLDRVGPALEKRNAEAQFPGQISDSQHLDNIKERMFIDALFKLPHDFRMQIINRAQELQQAIQEKGGDVQSHGTMRSTYPDFREAVIEAGNTFNPRTNEISLNGETRQVYDLFAKRPQMADKGGKYVWYPQASRDFLGRNEKSGKVVGTEQIKPDESNVQKPPISETTTVADVVQGLKDTLEKSSDKGLWKKISDQYTRYSKYGVPVIDKMSVFRAKHVRAALEAAMESYANPGEIVGPAGRKFIDIYNSERPAGLREKSTTPRVELQTLLGQFFGNPFNQKFQVVVERLIGKDAADKLRGPNRLAVETGSSEALQPAGEKNPRKGLPTGNAPEEDLVSLIRDFMYRRLGETGMSGQMRDMYTELGAAAAMKLHGHNLTVYRIQDPKTGGHVAKLLGTKGAEFGINVDRYAKSEDLLRQAQQANLIFTDVLHEISHIDDFISAGYLDRPDAYSAQREKQLAAFDDLARRLTPAERNAIIRTWQEGTAPEGFRGEQSGTSNRTYGSDSPWEFRARINEVTDKLLLMSALGPGPSGGKRTAWDVLDYMPKEVSDYVRFRVRSFGDVVEALQETLTNPKYRRNVLKIQQERGDNQKLASVVRTDPITSHAFRAAVEISRAVSRFREADVALNAGRQLLAGLDRSGGYTPLQDIPIWRPDGYDVPTEHLLRVQKAVDEHITEPWFGVDKSRQGIFKLFYPFFNVTQAMERAGVPLARDVEVLARGIKAAVNRGITQVYDPFIVHDTAGRPRFDADAPLVKALKEQPNGRWRKAFNRVRAVQNTLDGMSMFSENNGKIEVNPKMQQHWDKLKDQLTPEEQNIVMNASLAQDKASQIAGRLMVAGIRDSLTNRVARLLMTADRNLFYRDARQKAGLITEAYFEGAPEKAVNVVDPEILGTIDGILGGPNGLISKANEATQMLQSRPGHSTESLPYDWVIRYKTRQNDVKFLSAPTKSSAVELAKRLTKEGNSILGEIKDRTQMNQYNHFDAPDEVLSKYMDAESAQWDKFVGTMGQKYGPSFESDLRGYIPGSEAAAELERRGLQKFLKEQTGRIDRKRYDYLEGFEHWVPRVVASTQYKSVRQQLELIMFDPRARGFPDFQDTVRTHFNYVFTPTADWANKMSAALGAYYLGGNLSSAFVELTQAPSVLVPVLIDNGSKGPVKAYKQLFTAVRDTQKFSLSNDWKARAERVKSVDPKNWSLQDTLDSAYARAVQDGSVDHGVIQEITYSRDMGALRNSSFGTGEYTPTSPFKLATDFAYVGSQYLMRLYSWAALFNNKLGFLAGVRQAYEQGLRGDAAYQHGLRIKDLSQFAGGKANSPMIFSKASTPLTKNAFTVMKTLQQYGFGLFATYSELSKRALGRHPELQPGERLQAQKALGTMLMTQTAIGGVFGLPFAAAAMTMLEKTFGIEANNAIRQGMAHLGQSLAMWTDDKEKKSEFGARLADLALTGAGNTLLGVDLSSRAGVSNLMGTSAYEGFNLKDLLGPAPSIVENVLKAGNLFSQHEPLQAGRALAPQAFKNVIDMADTYNKYGDLGMRDSSGNLLYRPTPVQNVEYAIGFRPAQIASKRKAQAAITLSEQNARNRRDHELDTAAAQLMQGNVAPAQTLAREMMAADPTLSLRDFYRSIMQRATDASYEKDLMHSGMHGNDAQRLAIAQSYGENTVQSRSELDYLREKMNMAMRLGMPQLIQNNDVQKATMVDALMKSRNMTRGQALQLVEFINKAQSAAN